MPIKVHLVIIDPQNDFMGEAGLDANGLPKPLKVDLGGVTMAAALPVPGATDDMRRLAGMVDRVGPRLEDIHVTLDSHHVIDISHSGMWRNAQGASPPPFTVITGDDMDNDIWTARRLGDRTRLRRYLQALADQKAAGLGSYDHMIWPEHCLMGHWGHNVFPELQFALDQWCRNQLATIDYITKGTNVYTEHFGGLQAEVPDPTDSFSQLNARFLTMLEDADIIAVGGEAASHCVRSTVLQIANNIGKEHLKKFHLLTDAMSPVLHPVVDFPAIVRGFYTDMEAQGMTLTTTDKFLA